ncbi:MAG: GNAT family N-acetyltransferase [Candidatus Delongbacteria bacterium]|jgi:ribosomal-protein-alanine N-acetyltransferase|nr:GNAT family N-acetyltransferase [Candidatus Delongbacteria bacterium]
MIKTELYNSEYKPSIDQKENVINFLFNNLQEYGDPRSDIEKAIAYALQEIQSFGGFVLVSYSDNEISGVVVVNETGMKDYIPENILVYIATHKEMRGKGIGKFLMKKSIELANGNIALHVEPDNPARYLYEKVGFSSKYIEMRHIK